MFRNGLTLGQKRELLQTLPSVLLAQVANTSSPDGKMARRELAHRNMLQDFVEQRFVAR